MPRSLSSKRNWTAEGSPAASGQVSGQGRGQAAPRLTSDDSAETAASRRESYRYFVSSTLAPIANSASPNSVRTILLSEVGAPKRWSRLALT